MRILVAAPTFLRSGRHVHAGVISHKAMPLRPIPGEQIPHPDGWQSASCKHGTHVNCYALKCSCPHHGIGIA